MKTLDLTIERRWTTNENCSIRCSQKQRKSRSIIQIKCRLTNNSILRNIFEIELCQKLFWFFHGINIFIFILVSLSAPKQNKSSNIFISRHLLSLINSQDRRLCLSLHETSKEQLPSAKQSDLSSAKLGPSCFFVFWSKSMGNNHSANSGSTLRKHLETAAKTGVLQYDDKKLKEVLPFDVVTLVQFSSKFILNQII